jgi:hypothetical protein
MSEQNQMIRFRGIRIDSTRYALYTQPWTDSREPITELGCLECRDSDMPRVLISWIKISVLSVLTAIANHEKNHHPEAPALRAVS